MLKISLESQNSEACEFKSQLCLPLLDFAWWGAFTSIYNYQIFFNFRDKPVKWLHLNTRILEGTVLRSRPSAGLGF